MIQILIFRDHKRSNKERKESTMISLTFLNWYEKNDYQITTRLKKLMKLFYINCIKWFIHIYTYRCYPFKAIFWF